MAPAQSQSVLRKLIPVVAPIAVIIGLTLGALGWIKARYGTGHGPGRPGDAISLSVGSTLPDLVLHEFGGPKRTLSQVAGRVTILNFWATWCTACVTEMPTFVRLRQDYLERGLAFIPVSVDESPDSVLPRFLGTYGMDFPNYIDVKQDLSERLGIVAIPLTIVLDKDRKIVFIEDQEKDWSAPEFRKRLDSWLTHQQ